MGLKVRGIRLQRALENGPCFLKLTLAEVDQTQVKGNFCIPQRGEGTELIFQIHCPSEGLDRQRLEPELHVTVPILLELFYRNLSSHQLQGGPCPTGTC